ncbi:MAG TPA: DUF86 domain-containing protein [Planococcus sp. (in: firmicutes)]|nr:DUF86 domain-containing protein [Planococcus sp. (in: firmicutes)]
MYFVDRAKIKETVDYMNQLLKVYEEKKEWQSVLDQLALERLAQNVIESIIDVGNSMIDGFIMRDPGSYSDIIDILADEGVISAEMHEPLKEVIELRKMLVREFSKADHGEIVSTFNRFFEALIKFGPKVDHYLQHELGSVSAFLPEKD